MSKFTVIIPPGTKHDLANLPVSAQRSLESALAELEQIDNPRERLIPLKGKGNGLFSIRTVISGLFWRS